MLSRKTLAIDVFSSTGWATLLLTVLLSVLVLRILLTRRKNVPPGPKGLPFVGYFPFLSGVPYKKLRDLSEIYGDVMSLNVVGTRVVHLGSYDAIKDAYVVQGNEFAGRPKGFSFFTWIVDNMGIAQSEGEEWKEHRRFALHTLRDFGFGRVSLEGRIQLIASDLIRFLEQSKEKPTDVEEMLQISTSNVICSLLFDRNFKPDDPVFQKIRTSIHSLFRLLPGANAFLSGPLVKYLPLTWVPGGKQLMREKTTFYDVASELINEHQETFDPSFLRDYVDAYLHEMLKVETAGMAEHSTFTIDRLKAIVLNLFLAGTVSTATVIHWALRILMLRPEVQQKVQEEIHEVIGNERFPSVMDQQLMPYTEATIKEVLRIASITPLSVFRSNPEEVKFRNYVIPKRSIILANLWAIHRDPKFWPEPEHFDPSRFLGTDGKVDKRDSFYPFSAGKRVCLGESLARMELFIFLSSILQKFTIEPEDGDTDAELTLEDSLLRTLKPYKLCAKPLLK